MGCKQVQKKKPEDKATSKIASEETNSNKLIESDIRVLFKVDNKVVFGQKFKSTTNIEIILKEFENQHKAKQYSNRYFIGKKILKSDSKTKLKEILGFETNEVNIDVKNVGLTLLSDTQVDKQDLNMIAKPLYDPFELVILNIQEKKITMDRKLNLEKFGLTSASCNGQNTLFISGGESSKNEKGNSEFCSIDLSSITPKFSELNYARNCHSMIYIPGNYVFIVGGVNCLNVEYYDISSNQIVEHSKLNKKKIEPTLCYVNNAFLYAITGYRNNSSNFAFERINLKSDAHTWEGVNIHLNSKVNFNQHFFAVAHYSEKELIFIGGDDIVKSTHSGKNHIFNFETEVLSEAPFPAIEEDFNEKYFIPVEKEKSILFPNFNRNDVKILLFSDGKIGHVNFEYDS